MVGVNELKDLLVFLAKLIVKIALKKPIGEMVGLLDELWRAFVGIGEVPMEFFDLTEDEMRDELRPAVLEALHAEGLSDRDALETVDDVLAMVPLLKSIVMRFWWKPENGLEG